MSAFSNRVQRGCGQLCGGHQRHQTRRDNIAGEACCLGAQPQVPTQVLQLSRQMDRIHVSRVPVSGV